MSWGSTNMLDAMLCALEVARREDHRCGAHQRIVRVRQQNCLHRMSMSRCFFCCADQSACHTAVLRQVHRGRQKISERLSERTMRLHDACSPSPEPRDGSLAKHEKLSTGAGEHAYLTATARVQEEVAARQRLQTAGEQGGGQTVHSVVHTFMSFSKAG